MIPREKQLWSIEYIEETYLHSYCTKGIQWIPSNYSLLEHTFNLQKDVDFIYNNFFKNLISKILTGGFKESLPFPEAFSSRKLPSFISKRASHIQSISLECGLIKTNPHFATDINTIFLPLNYKVLDRLFMFDFDFTKASGYNKAEEKRFRQEFSEETIKAMIIHELSHWVNNIFYNNHIDDFLLKIRNKAISNENIFFKYFEIDAQIHAITEIKRFYKDEWNTMLLSDVFKKYSSLYAIIAKFQFDYDNKSLQTWLKDLVKRMYRENLIGDNMRMEDLNEFF